MKYKVLSIAVSLLMFIPCMFAFTACSDHIFQDKWSSDNEYHWHACMDEGCEETAGKVEHTFGDWVVDRVATCAKKGSKHKECSVCGKTIVEEIPIDSRNHKYGTEVAEILPTCVSAGCEAHYHCPECTKNFQRIGNEYVKKTIEEMTIQELPHAYGEVIPEIPATCTTTGVQAHYQCADCHKLFIKSGNNYYEKTEQKLIIDALGHNYGEWIDEVPADYGIEGTKAHYECATCHLYFDGNYEEIADLTIPSIPPKDDEISIVVNNKTYDKQTLLASASATSEKDVTIMYRLISGTDEDYVTTAPTNAGVYYILASTIADAEWKLATKRVEITIEPKEVTLEWVNPELTNYVYDGNAKIPTCSIALGSIIVGDDVALSNVELTVGENNIDAGTFTFSVLSITNANYKLPTNVTSPIYIITKANIEIDEGCLNNNTVTYDGQGHNIIIDYSCFHSVNNQTITYEYKINDGEYSSTVPSIVNAGVYTIYVKASAPNHYTTQERNRTLTIEKAYATISWVTAPTLITYTSDAITAGTTGSENFVYSYSGGDQEVLAIWFDVYDTNVVGSFQRNGVWLKSRETDAPTNIGKYAIEMSALHNTNYEAIQTTFVIFEITAVSE